MANCGTQIPSEMDPREAQQAAKLKHSFLQAFYTCINRTFPGGSNNRSWTTFLKNMFFYIPYRVKVECQCEIILAGPFICLSNVFLLEN